MRFEGALGQGVTPKDMILHLIGKIGAAVGAGHAIEYGGAATRAMPVEGRLTICNLTVELGAKYGLIAPDERHSRGCAAGRPFAPQGALFDRALEHWRTLYTDDDAGSTVKRSWTYPPSRQTVTWGTSPEHAIPIDGTIPIAFVAIRFRNAQGLCGGRLIIWASKRAGPIAGTKVDWVFIGSCANSRLPDLREAAALARDRHVAPGVTAWVVPGSEQVKRDAEAEDSIRFSAMPVSNGANRDAACVSPPNGERVPPGARGAVSTSNRNFVGRQGPGARTHLASPAMAVAAAVTGALTDVRRL